MDIFDWRVAEHALPMLLPALLRTIELTLMGMCIALVLGLIFALLRRSPSVWISRSTESVIEFIRRTPLLVQVYFLFYVLPSAGIEFPPMATGVLALGIHYGAYCSEVYRAGIEAVPSGQWDAAAALNLGRGRTFLGIILPQALIPVIPALGNYLISMFKDTPILSVITVVELLQESKNIGANSFRYTEPLTMVGILFLVLSLICAGGIRLLERRIRTR